MLNELKNSYKRTSRANSSISRPFAPEILKRARTIAAQYQIIVWFEDGEYYGRGVELPGTMDDGKTPAQCVENMREALVATVAFLLESGETPPAPATEGKRDQQLNVRISSTEKLLLETKAKQSGAVGISEFIRAIAWSK